jgi:hypothetical protein
MKHKIRFILIMSLFLASVHARFVGRAMVKKDKNVQADLNGMYHNMIFLKVDFD